MDTWIHLAEVLAIGLLSWIGLRIDNRVKDIRLEQARVKEEVVGNQTSMRQELVASQNAMRQDMELKHAENKQGLAVHVAEDRVLFSTISDSLSRIHGKLDSLKH